MRAEEYFRDGNLQGALEDLQTQIRNQPDNSQLRIFLFQLLVVLGQWERALSQEEGDTAEKNVPDEADVSDEDDGVDATQRE